jgi:hypothetical protein
MTDRLAAKLRWFVENLDPPPVQLHLHDVWHDHDDGAGSALGSPADSPGWRQWMIPCVHVGRSRATICPACGIQDSEGHLIAESGLRRSERDVYRFPMRALMASLARAVPLPGRPGLAVTLVTLARSGGDAASAADILARAYPKMGDPRTARGHFLFALERAYAMWPEYQP